jgi:hypothetical protein
MLASMLLGSLALLATPQAETAESTAEPSALAAALDATAEGGWKDLRISVNCRTDESYDTVEIFGSGYGVWNGKTQIHLDEGDVRTLLAAFRDVGFPEMSETYGGKHDPEPGPVHQSPRLTCSVELQLGGHRKHVGQLLGGRQWQPLISLATTVLNACRQPAEDGLRAETLGEAVTKLADGTLAPEMLFLIVHRKPGAGDSDAGPESWVLQVEGRRATTRARTGDEGYATPTGLDLDDTAFRSLVSALSEADLGAIPGNLYADRYTDVTVSALGHRKRLQARQFAGMTSKTHGEQQKRFDALFEKLRELRSRVLAEGEPAPWATSGP